MNFLQVASASGPAVPLGVRKMATKLPAKVAVLPVPVPVPAPAILSGDLQRSAPSEEADMAPR